MTSAPARASRFAATGRMPCRSARMSRRSRRGCEATSVPASTARSATSPAMIASAITPAPTMPTRILRPRHQPSSSRRPADRYLCALQRPGRLDLASRALRDRSSRSTAAPARRRPARHLAELDHRPTHAERREPLLVLGADVAGLVDRLGIVAARAARVPRRGSEVPDPARLPCGLEREVRPARSATGRDVPTRPPATNPPRRWRAPWPRLAPAAARR